MPLPRSCQFVRAEGGAGEVFHCVSRVVDRRFVFGNEEKKRFRDLLRRAEAFSGVRVLTWCILDNHFHILVHITEPPEERLSEKVVLDRCSRLYSKDEMLAIREAVNRFRKQCGDREQGNAAVMRFLQRYVSRMHNLSEFMKTLKHRFTRWFNGTHDRVGTLWESRFKSVLVEGEWKSAFKVAAYVDLNAVRAGLVDDPAEYEWCGYAEAVGGDARARKGLAHLLMEYGESGDWRSVSRHYRMVMFGIGEERYDDEGKVLRRGVSPEALEEVERSGGKIPLYVLLRKKVRYFTDGLIVGSSDFVDEYFNAARRKTSCLGSEKRVSGARKMRGGDWEGMCSFRELQLK